MFDNQRDVEEIMRDTLCAVTLPVGYRGLTKAT